MTPTQTDALDELLALAAGLHIHALAGGMCAADAEAYGQHISEQVMRLKHGGDSTRRPAGRIWSALS